MPDPVPRPPIADPGLPAPPRVGLVCADVDVLATADPNGQAAHVRDLAMSLGRLGVPVDVWSVGDAADASELAPGVRVRRLRPRARPEPSPVRRSRAAADRIAAHETAVMLEDVRHLGRELAEQWAVEPPEIVHAHGLLSGLASVVARRDVPVPVLVTFHELLVADGSPGPAGERADSRRSRLLQAVARDVDGVVVGSAAESADAARIGARRPLSCVLSGGVNTEVFTDAGPTAPGAEHGRIVTVGGVTPASGVDDVVRVLRVLPAVELVIAAQRPADAVDPDLARLTAVAHDAGVSDRVRVASGQDPQALASLLRSADIVVDASWHATSGREALQAMACGRAVVASAVGAHVDLVADGVTGLLVPPRRPDTLTIALRALLGDEFGREAYGEAALDRACSRYGWDRIAGEHVSLYRRALGPVTASPAELDEDHVAFEIDFGADPALDSAQEAAAVRPAAEPPAAQPTVEPTVTRPAHARRVTVDLPTARGTRSGATDVTRRAR